MAQFWSNWGGYMKFSVIVMLVAVLAIILMFLREYLKATDKDYKYKHPKFFSLMTVCFFLAIEAICSLIFMGNGFGILTAEIFSVIIAVIVTPLAFYASKTLSSVIRNCEVVEYNKLINCTGMAMSDVDANGGSVCVVYKNKYIDAKATSDIEIRNGDEIRIVGCTAEKLICTKI